jgi:predicted hydrocarbon binding protein
MAATDLSPDQTVLANISNSISSMLGRGSRATMREAGKAASKDLWPNLPEHADPEQVAAIMQEAIAALDGFGELCIEPQADGSFKIQFKNCRFAQFTEKSGEPCGQQAICFFGFGLVEETLRRMTGTKMVVSLERRDEEAGVCYETATPR